jgi:hypothetical protein
MQIVKSVFLAAATVAVAFGAQAQSADEIVTKHIAAIGGMEKLKGINSIHLQSTAEVMGNEMATTTIILNGKGFKTEGEVMGSKMVQVITDKGGWAINPMAGGDAQALPEEAAKMAKDQLDIAGPLVDYVAKGNKVELKGQEKVGAVNAHKLLVTNKEGVSATYFIDPATFYVLKVVRTANMMGQDMDIAMSFSDYKKTDYGFVYPYTTETDMGGQFAITAKVKSLEINKAVDPKVFDMPAK